MGGFKKLERDIIEIRFLCAMLIPRIPRQNEHSIKNI